MIDEMNKKIEQVNKKTGVAVQLPTITESRLRLSSLTNFAAGSGLIALGIATKMTGVVVLGSLGIVSGVIMGNEARKKARKRRYEK